MPESRFGKWEKLFFKAGKFLSLNIKELKLCLIYLKEFLLMKKFKILKFAVKIVSIVELFG